MITVPVPVLSDVCPSATVTTNVCSAASPESRSIALTMSSWLAVPPLNAKKDPPFPLSIAYVGEKDWSASVAVSVTTEPDDAPSVTDAVYVSLEKTGSLSLTSVMETVVVPVTDLPPPS